jgi:hypothetical protein
LKIPLREEKDIPASESFLDKFNTFIRKTPGILPGEPGYPYELFLSRKYPN